MYAQNTVIRFAQLAKADLSPFNEGSVEYICCHAAS
jgi:hypothetical protein